MNNSIVETWLYPNGEFALREGDISWETGHVTLWLHYGFSPQRMHEKFEYVSRTSVAHVDLTGLTVRFNKPYTILDSANAVLTDTPEFDRCIVTVDEIPVLYNRFRSPFPADPTTEINVDSSGWVALIGRVPNAPTEETLAKIEYDLVRWTTQPRR